MRCMQRAIVAIMIGASLARPASAQVVYDGGAPTGVGASSFRAFEVLQGFSLGAATTFNAVRFWGFSNYAEDAPFVGTFTWRLYERSGSSIGNQLATGSAAPTAQVRALNASLSNDSYQYDFSVGARTLTAGDYFLAFTGATEFFSWEHTTPKDVPALIRSSTGTTLTSSNDMAFQLRATQVPEPSSVALMAAGMALVGMRVARQRRRRA